MLYPKSRVDVLFADRTLCRLEMFINDVANGTCGCLQDTHNLKRQLTTKPRINAAMGA
jgi:hypothetical protein